MTNKYRIDYHILGHESRIVESQVFEYPNAICVNEHINLPFQYSRVYTISHDIKRGYACLGVVGVISEDQIYNAEKLEKKLEEVKIIFDRLNIERQNE